MELKSTQIGQRLARHPYNRVRLLNAGIEVSGDKHQYLIPFNQLIDIQCKRGVVWGEMEFELPEGKVVRLHGTEWQQTQRFYHYLLKEWQAWSLDMSSISASVLSDQVSKIDKTRLRDCWMKKDDLSLLQQQIQETFQALPLPLQRLKYFEDCRDNYHTCLIWMNEGEAQRKLINQQWSECIQERYGEFFQTKASSQLSQLQCQAVINGEKSILVSGSAGSGKTSVLIARAEWLLLRQQALPEQILLLSAGQKSVEEINNRIQLNPATKTITVRTFHELALYIIRQVNRNTVKVSELETNSQKRRDFLIREWQKLCNEKKVQAKGWREWLNEELDWQLPDGAYWNNKQIQSRLSGHLDDWLELIRMHGGSQKEMLERVSPEYSDTFPKRIRLMAPLLKAWKSALKTEGTLDFCGLTHQAVHILQKGRFISPWKHILLDNLQDVSPLSIQLLTALQAQNKQSHIFAAGDNWQGVCRFNNLEWPSIKTFSAYFGESDQCILDKTYRFNEHISKVANGIIHPLHSHVSGSLSRLTSHSPIKANKKSVIILPEAQLESLLNKMSGYVTNQESILLLARSHFHKPDALKKSATRWPNLNINFMTIHESQGLQADYIIIVGLRKGKDGFPASEKATALEQVLLPKAETFSDTQEHRLLYVALTRAKKQIWLMQEPKKPSIFIHQLSKLGVPEQRNP
ncbi:DNA helicase IV [Xenorhabdus innexi]|uniref:DNA 3'-5' helicase n=1 Tax=Xenorhabdus innexi TaxID=290109 RepID=A0A1N6MVX4_9GAMM|nr:DNA helicase IV [Xenorhabdus innexi]PHM37521.1 DNA helicase IV [Xenorhabdus innexi]SIP72996.1 Helicase IV [Xenorhabdus innexi]